jgi:hypothetical protein
MVSENTEHNWITLKFLGVRLDECLALLNHIGIYFLNPVIGAHLHRKKKMMPSSRSKVHYAFVQKLQRKSSGFKGTLLGLLYFLRQIGLLQ